MVEDKPIAKRYKKKPDHNKKIINFLVPMEIILL